MKIISYEDYEALSANNRDQFRKDYPYFIDMENTADLKYQVDFGELYGIAALSEDEDIVAAWLPDGQYIFSDTSVSEVLAYIKKNYQEIK